ncbi:MAG: hypothetical protein ACRBBR_03215 [Cellvibrionaceae bacterium]
MTKKSLISKLTLTSIVTLVTLSVPLLYIIGYFFEYGRFIKFGVEPQYFPRTTQEYLISAYEFFIDLSIKILDYISNFNGWYLLFLPFIFMVLIVFLIRNEGKIKPKVVDSVESIRKNRVFQYLGLPIIGTVYGFGYVFSILTYVFVVPSIIAISVYVSGKSYSANQINKFEGCEMATLTRDKQCVFVVEEGVDVLSGLLVAKSKDYIALWDGSKTIVYPITGKVLEIRFGQLTP